MQLTLSRPARHRVCWQNNGARRLGRTADRPHEGRFEQKAARRNLSDGPTATVFVTTGQVSGYISAAALLDSLPSAEWLIADRGYDAGRFREASKDKRIRLRIPGRKSRAKPARYNKRGFKRRNRIEIMFGKLKH